MNHGPAVAIVLAFALIAPAARGDDDPRKAQANALFQEGLRLHNQDREADALERFRSAYDLYPTPAGLVALARSEQLLGQHLAALRHYRVAMKQPTLAPKSLELAKRHVAELEPMFARVELRGPKGLVVNVDGEEYILPVADPVDMKPGAIQATATYGRERYEGRAQAAAGALTQLELVPVKVPSVPSPSRTERAELGPETSPKGRFWDAGRVGGLSLVGVAGASLVASAVFSAGSFDHAERGDALSRQLGPSGCASSPASTPAACSELAGERRAVERDATWSTIFLTGGLASAAAGLAMFLWPRSAPVRLSPSAGAGGAGLSALGAF